MYLNDDFQHRGYGELDIHSVEFLGFISGKRLLIFGCSVIGADSSTNFIFDSSYLKRLLCEAKDIDLEVGVFRS